MCLILETWRYITNERQENCDAMDNELGIIKFENINKHLIGRIMSRSLNSFHLFWLAGHFRIPPVKFDLSKTGIKYKEAIIWKKIYYKKT